VLSVLFAALSAGAATQAYDVTEYFSVSGVLAGAVQCQVILNEGQAGNECDGALPFQPELSLRPWESGELFVKLGFAWGNGLNDDSPFELEAWAADLQDAVEDVNGHWAYLLNAWYLHRFRFRQDMELELTLGVIDPSDYLGENVYANDEYTQFMNQGLINGNKSFVTSYNPGGAAVLELGRWSVTAVAMWGNEPQSAEPFGFFGGQLIYRHESSLGEGIYRVMITGTGKSFPDPSEASLESRGSGLLSLDQAFGDTVGVFLRMGWISEDAAVLYRAIYSGGINLVGRSWGREVDAVGLGYAYLPGGNLDIESTHLVERYYRWVPHRLFELTADIQYMKDTHVDGTEPSGFIFGLRGAVPF